MLNPAHILEIALLLLVAFLIGAVLGSLVRLAVARLVPAKATAPSPVVVAEPPRSEEPPALVAAPVIGPVVKTPTPTAPADISAPDFTEALLALAGDKPGSPASEIRMPSLAPLPAVVPAKPAEAMRPARVAGQTTSGQVVAHPRSSGAPARVVTLAASAEVIPFPLEKHVTDSPEPRAAVFAPPVPAAELAPPVVVAQQASKPEPKVVDEPVIEVKSISSAAAELEPATSAPAEEQVEPTAAAIAEVETIAAPPVPAVDTSPAANDAVVNTEMVSGTVAEVAAADADVLPDQVAAVAADPVVAPEHTAEDDEGAAMRAIEGNWSPRRTASPRPRKVDLREVSAEAAVLASAAAVAAAAQAANLATAAEPEAPGRPVGIPEPRLGLKDDLTHVIGILPIIETALNNLGLYHFEQVAELTDENAGWIENHLGITGRIGREHWREQARELALAMAGTKKAAGQQ